MCGSCIPGLEAVEQLQNLVLGVRGQRVPSAVHGYARASREVITEPDVGGSRLVKLDVPIAKSRYLTFGLFTERDRRESRAIWWCRPDREQFGPCERPGKKIKINRLKYVNKLA